MKKTKWFVDFFLVVMLSLVIPGMSEVVAQLVYKLPIEGKGWEIIRVALVFELQIFSIFLWIEAVINARPLGGEWYWKRVGKNFMDEMHAWKWIITTALVALVASSLTSVVSLIIGAWMLDTFEITVEPFVQVVFPRCLCFLLIAIDMSVASWIQKKVKKKFTNKFQTSKGD